MHRSNRSYRKTKAEPNLKIIRLKLGYSQKELAELSSIPLLTIQQYEQRQKSINKTSTKYLVMLSKSLFCSVEDLFALLR